MTKPTLFPELPEVGKQLIRQRYELMLSIGPLAKDWWEDNIVFMGGGSMDVSPNIYVDPRDAVIAAARQLRDWMARGDNVGNTTASYMNVDAALRELDRQAHEVGATSEPKVDGPGSTESQSVEQGVPICKRCRAADRRSTDHD